MKRLLLAIAFLFSLSGNAQTTTFNLGWNGTPEKILCGGDTWIVYGSSSYGPGYLGNLMKFKKVGNEYQMSASLSLPEYLNDFRFVDGKLRVVSINEYACDYYPYDLNYYEIDTASFTIIKSDIIDQEPKLIQAGFSTDSTIFKWTNNFVSDSIIYNVNTGLKSIHGLSAYPGVGSPTDFVTSVFDDKFLFVHSLPMASYFMVPVNASSFRIDSVFAGSADQVLDVYSYSGDSLLVLTDQNLVKLDTHLYWDKIINIPAFTIQRVMGDKMYLADSQRVLTYGLPEVNLIATDSLKGLPPGFEIKDIYPLDSAIAVLAFKKTDKGGLYQTVLKAKVSSYTETARHEISLDSAVFVQADWLSGKQVDTYRIYVSNLGTDTIDYFNVQFQHLTNFQCNIYDYSDVNLTIPPGETKSFTKDVVVDRAGKICFYASVSEHRLEDNLSDNESCVSATIGLDENSLPSLISFYPNPSVGEFHIEGELKDLKTILLLGIDGREIDLDITSSTDSKMTIDLSELPKGIYFLQLKVGGEVITQKVIKE